ncbi:MAG: AsmA-like C-terminal region-containing protein [Chthoniobacterales bacterium]
MKVSPHVRWLIRGFIRLFLVVVFIGIPGVILYFRQIGFNAETREQLCALVRKEGVEMEMQKLTFDPFQGLIAQDVKVRTLAIETPLFAHLNQVGLSISLRALFHHKIAVDTATLHGAQLTLPLDSKDPSNKLELTRVDAKILFLPEEIQITSLECRMGMLKLHVMGNILHPDQLNFPKNATGKSDNHFIQTVMDIRKLGSRFSLEGMNPLLDFQFTVDFADIHAARVENIRFLVPEIRYEDSLIHRLEIDATYHDSEINLERLAMTDALGNLTARGNYVLETRKLSFEASSTMDVRTFLPDTIRTGALKDVEFLHPPQAAFSGQLKWDEAGKISGQVFGRFIAAQITIHGVDFQNIDGEYTWKDGTFFTENFTFNIGDGKAVADIFYAPDDFRLRLTSTIRPTDLAPLMDKGTRETIERMQFADLPNLHVELYGKKPDIDLLSGTGQLSLGKTSMRGAWLTSGNSSLEILGRAITLKNLSAYMGNYKGTATFTYDFGQKEVRIAAVNAQLPTYDVLQWVNPKVAEATLPYRFNNPPTIIMTGVAGTEGSEKNQMDIHIDAPTGLTYKLLGEDLPFGATKIHAIIHKDDLTLNIPQAKLFGGQVAMDAKINLDPHTPVYSANVNLRQCDFTTLTKLYFNYNTSHGKVSGNYKFKTNFTDAHTMVGEGNIIVENGNVFAIPVLGPLSDILNSIIPGSGYQNAKTATTDFKIADGVISTKNLRIESPAFSLYGNGKLFFLEDKMDMNIRINARGIPGIILFPVSKVFEYTSDGSLKNPTWRPKLIPKIMFGH